MSLHATIALAWWKGKKTGTDHRCGYSFNSAIDQVADPGKNHLTS